MSDSVRPHRRQPTRLPRPWDSPGKNTGVGCHFLLQRVKVKSLSHVRPSATPWTAAYQAPPSMGFSRQEYWSGVPLPSPIKCLFDSNIWISNLSVTGILISDLPLPSKPILHLNPIILVTRVRFLAHNKNSPSPLSLTTHIQFSCNSHQLFPRSFHNNYSTSPPLLQL